MMHPVMTSHRSAFAAALLVALGIPQAALATAAPLTGNWAGDRVALSITSRGARITADCADGSIDGPLQPDRHGRFRANGNFASHRPGPQLADETVPAAATRFDGAVAGNTLALTITEPGGVSRKVTLVRNAHLKPVRCL